MRRRPPRSTRTDTLFPDTTLFRSVVKLERGGRGRILNGTLAIPPPPVAKIAFAGVRKRRDMLAMQAVEAAPHMPPLRPRQEAARSEEHTSELQSLMRISYAVFCLKKKK